MKIFKISLSLPRNKVVPATNSADFDNYVLLGSSGYLEPFSEEKILGFFVYFPL